MTPTKVCYRCKCDKPLSAFCIRSCNPDGRNHVCKDCVNEWKRTKRRTDPKWRDRTNTRKRLAPSYSPDVRRVNELMKRYGVTGTEYHAMLKKQGGGCAICGATTGGPGKNHENLCVDHCHTTNAIRGLLCVRCNLILGKANDSVELLSRCIEYLRQFIRKAA